MEPRCKSISSTFPIDLTSEILLRLPEKSFVRFRCVSKIWLSITTGPYFINSFETRNPRQNLLLCFKEGGELVVSSIPQHALTLDPKSRMSSSYSQPTNPYRMKFPKFREHLSPTASVHGLICFRTSTTAIVWNPSTREFLTLPKPSKSWRDVSFFLGYDAIEGKHKVVALASRSTCRICRVITLGSAQETWRIVKTNQKHKPKDFGQCINGVIYYLATTYWTFPYAWVLMRFDVRSEKLDAIQFPSDSYVDRLINYEGRLACVYKENYTEKNGITLSILEDAEENKWLSKDFLAPFTHHDQSLQINFKLIGFSNAGEFIYKPTSLYLDHRSLYALFFNPVRNSFRRFGFNGIVDDDDEERVYPFHFFPNHIETQMSL